MTSVMSMHLHASSAFLRLPQLLLSIVVATVPLLYEGRIILRTIPQYYGLIITKCSISWHGRVPNDYTTKFLADNRHCLFHRLVYELLETNEQSPRILLPIIAARLGTETPPNCQTTLKLAYENPCAIDSEQRVYSCSQSSTAGGTTINDVAPSISGQHCDGIVAFTLILYSFYCPRQTHMFLFRAMESSSFLFFSLLI